MPHTHHTVRTIGPRISWATLMFAVVVSACASNTATQTAPTTSTTPADSTATATTNALPEIRIAALIDNEFIGSDGDTSDTRFRIGSTTKTFIAVVLVQLAAEGQLGLDDTASDYIDLDSTATIRQLLSHRGGIIDDPNDPAFLAAWNDQTNPDIAPLTDTAQLGTGTNMAYSNAGYIYAGDIIAAVTGEHPAEAIRTRIIEPLGLDHTCWPGQHNDCRTDLDGVVNTKELGLADQDVVISEFASIDALSGSAGALISTTSDLARFITALFNNELPGTQALIDSATDNQYAMQPGDDFYGAAQAYGLGIIVNDQLVGHSGGTFGFQSLLTHNPTTNQTTALLVNDASIDTAAILQTITQTQQIPTETELRRLR